MQISMLLGLCICNIYTHIIYTIIYVYIDVYIYIMYIYIYIYIYKTMCNNKHVESTMADCHDSTRSPASNTSEKW